MQLAHRRHHLGIFGAGGNGKTTFAQRYLANASSNAVFCFDPEGEFSQAFHIAPARTFAELDESAETGWVCFDPHTLFPGDLEKALDFFAAYTLRVCARRPGRKFFAVDELGWYVTGQAIPKNLRILVQSGRRKAGIDCVFIGQAPNEIHNYIRAQLTEVVCFQLTEDCALEFPRKFGFDTESVRGLPRFNYIARTNQGGELRRG